MIGVVIPCYKVKSKVMGVIAKIGNEVQKIYIIDDGCPERTGEYVKSMVESPERRDTRVKVIIHRDNQGVGGAMATGYREALKDKCDIIVKIDGDGQMDPGLIKKFVNPILNGDADYTKGNRFYQLQSLRSMPSIRLFGNSVLSFVNKMASGYWNVMDPTNGYTAIHKSALLKIDLDKLAKRYFFESDIMFRLNTIRAVVSDVPMEAVYGDEVSSLEIGKVSFEFPFRYLKRFSKRIFYNYFLRDFNVASIEIACGLPGILWGIGFGLCKWRESIHSGVPASSGTVMLAALPIILGFQMLLSALQYDINNLPKRPLQSD